MTNARRTSNRRANTIGPGIDADIAYGQLLRRMTDLDGNQGDARREPRQRLKLVGNLGAGLLSTTGLSDAL